MKGIWKGVLFALMRGVLSQLSLRTWLLALSPFILSILLWGGFLWLCLQPIIDAIQYYFAENDGYAMSGKWLAFFGLAALKTVIVPLIAMWILLPFMVTTTLAFVGALAMPALMRQVFNKYYPALEKRGERGIVKVLWVGLQSFVIFIVLWIITTPLCALPFVGFLIQPLLWGGLTSRVIAYEVLAVYADSDEMALLMRQYRRSFLLIGTIAGVLGVAPSLLWLGGTMSILLFPFFAALSILLYVLVFTFSGLWFTHFGLATLASLRQSRA